ncbi:MAG: ANTAR domain-containing protein [Eubacteriales bacterium]
MINVIVVFPKAEDAKNIKILLSRNGYQVTAVCTTGAQAIAHADGLSSGIIISSYKLADMMYSEIKECMPAGFELLLLASQNNLSQCYEKDIMMLAMPLKTRDLFSTLEMMGSNIVRRRQRAKLKPKQRSGTDTKYIKEAKALLMERNDMTEDEAHRYIQKCSMDSCTNMVETAQMILSMMKV